MNIPFSRQLFASLSGGTALVGFSGGADSTAALLVTMEAARELDFKVMAVHFNHHLRGEESDQEAAEAELFCNRIHVDFLKIDLYIPPGGNLEARARRTRLKHWQRLCSENPPAAVVTGHHQDDRIENILLRACRGSNLSGLTALRSSTVVGGITFIRPLADISRRDIEEFLQQRGITAWAQDSSNAENFTARNIVRNHILPELTKISPGGRSSWVRTLEMLSCDGDFIEKYFEKTVAETDIRAAETYRTQHRAIAFRMLRRLLAESFNGNSNLTAQTAERFFTAVTKCDGDITIPLGEGRDLKLCSGRLIPLHDPPVPAGGFISWKWRKNREICFGKWLLTAEITRRSVKTDSPFEALFAAGDFPETLILRLPEPGMTMVPFDKDKPVKVKKLRVDRHISATEYLPLISDEKGEILWYAGVRHSQSSKVIDNREEMLFFQCKIRKS